MDGAGAEFIRGVLAEESELTLKELCQQYQERFAREVSKSSLDRALRRLGLTRKKRASLTPSRRRSVSNRNVRSTRRKYRP